MWGFFWHRNWERGYYCAWHILDNIDKDVSEKFSFLRGKTKPVQAGRQPPRFHCTHQYCSTLFPLQVAELWINQRFMSQGSRVQVRSGPKSLLFSFFFFFFVSKLLAPYITSLLVPGYCCSLCALIMSHFPMYSTDENGEITSSGVTPSMCLFISLLAFFCLSTIYLNTRERGNVSWSSSTHIL